MNFASLYFYAIFSDPPHFLTIQSSLATMAEAPVLPKTLEEMEKEISCSVCLGHYREPKILPCLHYYCTECLQRLAARVGQPVPCPECRKETTFPQNDARQLPTPFFVNRMIDLYGNMQKAEGKVEAVCEMCSSTGKAEAFCRQCTEFICSECVKSHRRLKVFSGHEIMSMEQLRGGGARLLSAQEPPPMKCKEHDEVLKLFCFTCNCLICRDCIIYDHADHNHEFVKKSAPQCREKLRESLAPLQQVQAEITAAVSNIQTAKREVAENHATVSDTISQSIDQLIAILQRRKRELLAKASELAEEKLGALGAQEKCLNISLAEAQSMVDFVERSLENATDEELLEMKQQIVTGVEESCKKQRQVDLQPAAKANIGTDMSCDQQALRVVGLVGLDVIDLTKCRVEGVDSKEVEINKPAQFTLHLVDSTSSPYKGLPSIMAEAKSHVDRSVVPAAITPGGSNGTYIATYTPQVRGRHYITVRVNGKEVSGSPFSVFVRIPPDQLQQPVRKIEGVTSPIGITISNNDEVLVSDFYVGRVSIFVNQGSKLRTVQLNNLPNPYGVATDPDGNIYSSCGTQGGVIVKFDKDGHTLKIAKEQSSYLRFQRVINGVLYVCCEGSDAVLVYDCNTLQCIRSFGKRGEGNGEFKAPIDVLSVNGEVYVSDCDNQRIQVFDQEGLNFARSFKVKNTSTQKLCCPCGMCVGPDGLLYVACCNPSCVLVFTLSGEFVASSGVFHEVSEPRGIAVDSDGFVYVCCSGGLCTVNVILVL